jgi:hypothetical protein
MAARRNPWSWKSAIAHTVSVHSICHRRPTAKRGRYGNAPEYERKSDGSWQCPKMTEEPKLAWWARNTARAAAKMPNVSGGSKAKRKTPRLGKPSSPKNCSGDTAMNNCPNPKIKRTSTTPTAISTRLQSVISRK